MYPTKFARTERGHELNAVPDLPDVRDFLYEPTLSAPRYPKLDPPEGLEVLNQGNEGACTGFALAAVINGLLVAAGRSTAENPVHASPRMLYRMAQRHDEWPGEDYSGSSVRGAIRGWHNMGVCEERLWPSRNPRPDDVTIERARNARAITLGAYYRLRPRLADFHAAINETRILYVSAQVHSGWNRPARDGLIVPGGTPLGGHAFALVGYDERGFWVQNSWGRRWGASGLGLWTYEDWVEGLMDAWVVQLAYPAPSVFGREARKAVLAGIEVERREVPAPRRIEIAGHFVHVDDGAFKTTGKYWSREDDIAQTAHDIATKEKYPHLLVYAHGGLNSPDDSATRIAAMREGFKRNGVYPFHIMYDTGLSEEITDLVASKFGVLRGRTEGFFDDIDRFKNAVLEEVEDRSDNILEGLLRTPGTAIWREMKRDASVMFDDGNAGLVTLRLFLDAFAKADTSGAKRIHMAGHSTGGVLLAHLLETTRRVGIDLPVESVALLAPACTVDLFKSGYVPSLRGAGGGASIARMTVYNLTKELEKDDNVAAIYRKSLLYLVSRAFEDTPDAPIAGMEIFKSAMPRSAKLEIVYADPDRANARSRSRSHGGFDNDPNTMNDVLKGILGHKPAEPFTEEELAY